MYDQTPSGRRRLRGLALVPALALALAVTDLPAVASVLSHTSAASLRGLAAAPAETVSKVTQKAATVQAPAVQEEPVEPAATAPSGTEATFPGGLPALFDFLAKNISYPKSLIESGAKGRVEVHFIVTADGTPTDFKITKSLTPDADAEVLRVCRLMPKWKPAVADGKPASSDFILPVDFKPQPSSSKSDKK